MDEELEILEEETEEETVEEEKTEKTTKPREMTPFEKTIQKYLDDYAAGDEPFAAKYKNEKKTIFNCCDYIIDQVQKSHRKGFNDDEIYYMARHFYEEDSISADQKNKSCNVVVNHVEELTEEEKQAARENAKKQFEAQELQRLQREQQKEEAKKQKAVEKEQLKQEKAKQKAIEEKGNQLSLDDLFGGL